MTKISRMTLMKAMMTGGRFDQRQTRSPAPRGQARPVFQDAGLWVIASPCCVKAEMATITRMERDHLSVIRTGLDGQPYYDLQHRENGRNVTAFTIENLNGNRRRGR